MKMSLLEIAKAIHGNINSSCGNKEINLVVTDSRDVPVGDESGTLFAAIRGEKVDGHSFVADITKKDASEIKDKDE